MPEISLNFIRDSACYPLAINKCSKIKILKKLVWDSIFFFEKLSAINKYCYLIPFLFDLIKIEKLIVSLENNFYQLIAEYYIYKQEIAKIRK